MFTEEQFWDICYLQILAIQFHPANDLKPADFEFVCERAADAVNVALEIRRLHRCP